jgi:hypothetical protein
VYDCVHLLQGMKVSVMPIGSGWKQLLVKFEAHKSCAAGDSSLLGCDSVFLDVWSVFFLHCLTLKLKAQRSFKT